MALKPWDIDRQTAGNVTGVNGVTGPAQVAAAAQEQIIANAVAAQMASQSPQDEFGGATPMDLIAALFGGTPASSGGSSGSGYGGGGFSVSPQVQAALSQVFANLGLNRDADMATLDSQEADIERLSKQYANKVKRLSKSMQRTNKRAMRGNQKAVRSAGRQMGKVSRQTADAFSGVNSGMNDMLSAFGVGGVDASSRAGDAQQMLASSRGMNADMRMMNRMSFNDNRVSNAQWRGDTLAEGAQAEMGLLAQIAKARADAQRAWRDQQAQLQLQAAQSGYKL